MFLDSIWGDIMIDPQDPTLAMRLKRRTPEGRYEIGEIELVLAIRELDASGDRAGSQMLCAVLLERSAPEFQRHSYGLRHRPDLREEAIANMSEHLLREAKNPKEQFITQNFIHYLRCLCVDEFNRVLRQEGLRYSRDEDGRPAGRPMHVPRSLMEPLQTTPLDSDLPPSADVADPGDQYEHLHAREESLRILMYLTDPLDKKIMVLRAIEGWKWDEIALACERNERTIRLRFDKARNHLQECLANERMTYGRNPTQRNEGAKE
jgi:DNA-directed RNA polymerase specialized sigma24 family protein